jgi:hypothetical protein
MAVKANNLSGLAVITDANQIPKNTTGADFVDIFTYADKEMPELIPELVYQYGKGSILGFMKATQSGKKKTYESDYIQHQEIGRLHKNFTGVTIAGNVFTFPSAHGLEPKRVVRFFTGNVEYQGIVSAVAGLTATILSDGAAWPVGPVNVAVDFSSRFKKGDSGFSQGTTHGTDTRKNYSHIFGHYQDTTNSDMGQAIWIKTANGPQWWSTEFARESAKFDNITELTAVFHKRATDASDSAVAGEPQGMLGVKQIVSERGNVFADLITTTAQLSDMAFRQKQQGNCREVNMWCGHAQMAAFRILAATVNSAFLNGTHYGSFKNSKDMALNLDFVHIKIDGVQFNFVSWAALDSPEHTNITGANGGGGLSFLGVPCGNTAVTMNGESANVSYMDMLFRKTSKGVREKKTKFFGDLGTQVKQDSSYVDWLSEGTVLLAAANNFWVGSENEYDGLT